MNDKRRPWPERRRLELSPSVYRQSTRLQTVLRAINDTLADARDDLSDDEWRALIEILTDKFGHEAARLALGELLRARRESA